MKQFRQTELYKYLHPYQRVGVRVLQALNGRALLADQPGLGKTIQVIAYLAMNPQIRPAIIICPAIAKYHWKNTAEKWLKNDKIVVLSGRSTDEPEKGSIYIVNYDILANKSFIAHANFSYLDYPDFEPIKMNKENRVEVPYSGWIDYLADLKAKLIALDESQKTANKTQRTNAIQKIIKKTEHLICISGTPSENRPIELFNTISWIQPSLFPNKWSYQIRYCGAKNNGFGWDFSGASNIPELYKILTDNIMIRRTKKEVMGELPPKIRSVVPLDIENRTEYDYAEEDFSKWLKTVNNKIILDAIHLVKIEHLKQLAVKGKLKQVIEWIQDYLESGEKLVVFAEHKATVDAIMKKFGKIAVKVVGGVSPADREKAEKEFQTNKKIRLFVGNIEAAGVSLTLTKANAVAMIEMPKTPAKLEQCEDRVYGRINDCHGATIYFLVAVDTVEEDLAELLDRKAKVLTAMFDGEAITEENLLTSLLKKRFINSNEKV